MISVAECDAKIVEFSNIKTEIMGLIGSLEECSSQVTTTVKYTSEMIISGEPIDVGELDELSNVLFSVSTNLTTLVGECEALINKYTALRAEALAYFKRLEHNRYLSEN